MGCEAAVDKALPIGGLFRIATKQEDELAAPAEASRAEGQGGDFIGAEGMEKIVDTGFSNREAGIVAPGDEAG